MKLADLGCICCGKKLPGRDGEPVGDGLAFYSRGAFGSAVYDPGAYNADKEHLVVVVCDNCLVMAGETGQVGYERVQAERKGVIHPLPFRLNRWYPPYTARIAGLRDRMPGRADAVADLDEDEDEGGMAAEWLHDQQQRGGR